MEIVELPKKKINSEFLFPISACEACAWILNFEIDEPGGKNGKKGKNSFLKEGAVWNLQSPLKKLKTNDDDYDADDDYDDDDNEGKLGR